MPELPEVETTRRGIEPWLVGRRIERLVVREWRLRWRVPGKLPAAVRGATVRTVGRRAKYLLIGTDAGTLIWHLGMSGSLRVMPADAPPLAHDHVDLVLDSGRCLRFKIRAASAACCSRPRAPRATACSRGSLPSRCPTTSTPARSGNSRGRNASIKAFIMDARAVSASATSTRAKPCFAPASARARRQAVSAGRA